MPYYGSYGYSPTYQSPQSWTQNGPLASDPNQNYSRPMQTQQTASSSIVWVQGEAGAKAYPVASGNTILLMDSEDTKFYLKSTDLNGMPRPLRVFNYSEVVQNESQEKGVSMIQKTDTTQLNETLKSYVTRSEFNELKALIEELVGPETKK